MNKVYCTYHITSLIPILSSNSLLTIHPYNALMHFYKSLQDEQKDSVWYNIMRNEKIDLKVGLVRNEVQLMYGTNDFM